MKLFKDADLITYYSQRNNKKDPYKSCFRESMVMALVNNGIEDADPTIRNMAREFDAGDWIYGLFEAEYGSTEKIKWWGKMEEIFIKILNCSPIYEGNASDYVRYFEGVTSAQIKNEIDHGYCVVVGTSKLGGLSGGHIVCIVGYTSDTWILCDPYGDANTKYKSTDGNLVELEQKWLPNLEILGEDRYRAIFIHSDKILEI